MTPDGVAARPGRTFRVFVSSTFADLKAERDALQRHCFPRLRELCLRHGCRFQAVDLRWGVREEAALDQQTMRICLDEIARCQRTSPRPNFVVLLGDRYGWRPLPWQVPATEMDALRPLIRSAGDAALVDEWYRRDDNACPPAHVLEARVVGQSLEVGAQPRLPCRLQLVAHVHLGPGVVAHEHDPQPGRPAVRGGEGLHPRPQLGSNLASDGGAVEQSDWHTLQSITDRRVVVCRP